MGFSMFVGWLCMSLRRGSVLIVRLRGLDLSITLKTITALDNEVRGSAEKSLMPVRRSEPVPVPPSRDAGAGDGAVKDGGSLCAKGDDGCLVLVWEQLWRACAVWIGCGACNDRPIENY
jgi:hypothetical protein